MPVQTPVFEIGVRRFEPFLRSHVGMFVQRPGRLTVTQATPVRFRHIPPLLILDLRFWILDCSPANPKSKIQNPKSACRTGRAARRTSATRVVAGANPACDSIWKGQPTGDGSAVLTRRATSLAGSTPAPSSSASREPRTKNQEPRTKNRVPRT